eukprot:445966-Amorphochlora_amoeboformis.AAC.1
MRSNHTRTHGFGGSTSTGRPALLAGGSSHARRRELALTSGSSPWRGSLGGGDCRLSLMPRPHCGWLSGGGQVSCKRFRMDGLRGGGDAGPKRKRSRSFEWGEVRFFRVVVKLWKCNMLPYDPHVQI